MKEEKAVTVNMTPVYNFLKFCIGNFLPSGSSGRYVFSFVKYARGLLGLFHRIPKLQLQSPTIWVVQASLFLQIIVLETLNMRINNFAMYNHYVKLY